MEGRVRRQQKAFLCNTVVYYVMSAVIYCITSRAIINWYQRIVCWLSENTQYFTSVRKWSSGTVVTFSFFSRSKVHLPPSEEQKVLTPTAKDPFSKTVCRCCVDQRLQGNREVQLQIFLLFSCWSLVCDQCLSRSLDSFGKVWTFRGLMVTLWVRSFKLCMTKWA